MSIERALEFIGRGWAVFPVLPGGKRPLTRNGFKDATKSLYTARKMWEAKPDANVGLATGQVSGIVVVDVDVKKGAKGRESIASIQGMTPTLTVRTPSGGWHLYYRAPEDQMVRCRNGLLPGIDIKADGGYVVAPGSLIGGKSYQWSDPKAVIEPLPEPILQLMANGSRKASDAKAALKTPATITEGSRNETLTRLAGAMRAKGMAAEEIAAALKAANARRCSPPLSDNEIETIAASVARYPPRPNGQPRAPTDDDDVRPPGFTDDALALDFTARYAQDWRYVAAWGHWLTWDGARWVREMTLKAYDLARRVCRSASARCLKPKIAAKIAGAATVAAVERMARADRRHAATVEQWDAHPWLLNTPGGVVDLRTGAIRPGERSLYMTKMAAARPGDPNRPPSRWLAFLGDITDGDRELQRYLARMSGYALTGSTTEHALFFLYGMGGNGKSVFVNTLAHVLGDYATSAPMDTFLETRGERHPTDLAGLRGARLVASIEVEKGRRWAEAKIKSLTGGDKIAARFMRQDFFEYKPQFKLVIAGNNKPAIRDVDEAMRRRLHLVPFTVTIPKDRRDGSLPEKLLDERDGILRWAIEGCLEWQRIGLEPPARVVSATAEYLEAEDALGRWIDEECRPAASAETSTDELFASWKAWTEKWGEYTGTKRRFSDDLAKRGFQRTRSGRSQARGFRGIALRGKETQEDML